KRHVAALLASPRQPELLDAIRSAIEAGSRVRCGRRTRSRRPLTKGNGMNDWRLAISTIRSAIEETGRGNLTYSEKVGLYAGARLILSDLSDHVSEAADGHGYALEKIGTVQRHIGAALGFDVDNGHPIEQHQSWAHGD